MNSIIAKTWKKLLLPKNVQIAAMRATQDEFLIGVTGVILNDKNEILLCKHTYRGKSGWSLPGGYIKAKEHPKEALAREIEEETGLIVRVNAQYNLRTDRETARIDISLVGEYIGGEFRKSHEVSEADFFAFENLPVLMQSQLVLIKNVLDKRNLPAGPLRRIEASRQEKPPVDDKKLNFLDRVKFVMRGGDSV